MPDQDSQSSDGSESSSLPSPRRNTSSHRSSQDLPPENHSVIESEESQPDVQRSGDTRSRASRIHVGSEEAEGEQSDKRKSIGSITNQKGSSRRRSLLNGNGDNSAKTRSFKVRKRGSRRDFLVKAVEDDSKNIYSMRMAARANKNQALVDDLNKEHMDFARNLIPSDKGALLCRKPVIEQIDALCSTICHENEQPIVVCSGAGFGKSTILATWVLDRKAQDRDEFLFAHFSQCSRSSRMLSDFFKRFLWALKLHFSLRELEVNESDDDLRRNLPKFLEAVGKRKGSSIIIVLDGIDEMRLANGDEADPLRWLPRRLPPYVRFVTSCAKFKDELGQQMATGLIHKPSIRSYMSTNLAVGQMMFPHSSDLNSDPKQSNDNSRYSQSSVYNDITPSARRGSALGLWENEPGQDKTKAFVDMKRRACKIIPLPKFSEEELSSLVDAIAQTPNSWVAYLSDTQLETLKSCEAIRHPFLFKCIASVLEADKKVGQSPAFDLYITAGSPHQLIHTWLGVIESRIEEASDGSDRGILGSVLAMIYLSSRGLGDEEIRQALLLKWQIPLSDRQSFMMNVVLDLMCITRDGVRSFLNDIYMKVAWDRYIRLGDESKVHHETLVKYFHQHKNYTRRIEELPWHYENLGDWARVKHCLTDIDMFLHWWTPKYSLELVRHWRIVFESVETVLPNSKMKVKGYDLVEEYNRALEHWYLENSPSVETVASVIQKVSEFLKAFSHQGYESSALVPIYNHPKVNPALYKSLGVQVDEDILTIDQQLTMRQRRQSMQEEEENNTEGRNNTLFNLFPTFQAMENTVNRKKKRKKVQRFDQPKVIGQPNVTLYKSRVGPQYYFYRRWIWTQFPWMALEKCHLVDQAFQGEMVDEDVQGEEMIKCNTEVTPFVSTTLDITNAISTFNPIKTNGTRGNSTIENRKSNGHQSDEVQSSELETTTKRRSKLSKTLKQQKTDKSKPEKSHSKGTKKHRKKPEQVENKTQKTKPAAPKGSAVKTAGHAVTELMNRLKIAQEQQDHSSQNANNVEVSKVNGFPQISNSKAENQPINHAKALRAKRARLSVARASGSSPINASNHARLLMQQQYLDRIHKVVQNKNMMSPTNNGKKSKYGIAEIKAAKGAILDLDLEAKHQQKLRDLKDQILQMKLELNRITGTRRDQQKVLEEKLDAVALNAKLLTVQNVETTRLEELSNKLDTIHAEQEREEAKMSILRKIIDACKSNPPGAAELVALTEKNLLQVTREAQKAQQNSKTALSDVAKTKKTFAHLSEAFQKSKEVHRGIVHRLRSELRSQIKEFDSEVKLLERRETICSQAKGDLTLSQEVGLVKRKQLKLLEMTMERDEAIANKAKLRIWEQRWHWVYEQTGLSSLDALFKRWGEKDSTYTDLKKQTKKIEVELEKARYQLEVDQDRLANFRFGGNQDESSYSTDIRELDDAIHTTKVRCQIAQESNQNLQKLVKEVAIGVSHLARMIGIMDVANWKTEHIILSVGSVFKELLAITQEEPDGRGGGSHIGGRNYRKRQSTSLELMAINIRRVTEAAQVVDIPNNQDGTPGGVNVEELMKSLAHARVTYELSNADTNSSSSTNSNGITRKLVGRSESNVNAMQVSNVVRKYEPTQFQHDNDSKLSSAVFENQNATTHMETKETEVDTKPVPESQHDEEVTTAQDEQDDQITPIESDQQTGDGERSHEEEEVTEVAEESTSDEKRDSITSVKKRQNVGADDEDAYDDFRIPTDATWDELSDKVGEVVMSRSDIKLLSMNEVKASELPMEPTKVSPPVFQFGRKSKLVARSSVSQS